ncbi:MAG: VCBS repeat-containing protein [Acidobacteria bacterium]|nr:VCBS repeat-containing protein [Acidobacteriota bacterium]
MKRLLIVLGALALIALGLITVLQKQSQQVTDLRSDAADTEKQRIRKFWTLYNQANADRTSGNLESAVAGFRECLELDSKHENSLYNLGTSLAELGDYRQAAATFQRLIEVNPASNRAYSELGNTLALLAPGALVDFQAARGAFERSVQINPEQAGPFLQLGKLEFNQGDLEAALEHFRVAAGFQSPDGNFLAGYALFSKGKYSEALEFFRNVLQIHVHEKAIARRGVRSEGDILPVAGRPMSPLEKASLKSLLFLYWSSTHLGGYPPAIPKELQVHKPPQPSLPFLIRTTTGTWKSRGGHCLEQLQQAGHVPEGTVVECIVDNFNGDANPDLFILRWRREAILYLNQGNGKFSDATMTAGLSGLGWESFSAVFFDYDRDSLPDLLVTSHAPFDEAVRSLLQTDYKATQHTPRLFRNKGAGRFEETTAQVGLHRSYGTMQGIAADFDGDGWVDLLLVNGSLDRLRLEPSVVLRNLEGKEFRELAYLPDFDKPDNFIDATLEGHNRNGDLVVNLVRNSFFGRP